MKRIAVIGGGAAGFFGAIRAKELCPDAEVILLEKTSKLLAKVRVSGGGRCNVTHNCFDDAQLIMNYPRGGKELRAVFSRFSVRDTIQWFAGRKVMLHTEEDGRMFPVTNDSFTIVNCLASEAGRLGVDVRTKSSVEKIKIEESKLILVVNGKEHVCDAVLVAAGGNPHERAYNWLKDLGHTIIPPVPSLFTFNLPQNSITKLMGLSVDKAKVSIKGTKLSNEGPLLVTHWGFSGPAVLKLSALAARELSRMNYDFTFSVNWLPSFKQVEIMEKILAVRTREGKKSVYHEKLFDLPKRLWEFLLEKSGIQAEQKWADLSKEQMNKLVSVLNDDSYNVKGKTTFKEEFVTCGGVSLKEVDMRTMESKKVPGLFFAGEVLDIDAVTGGFNFQAAWSTSWLAAFGIQRKLA